MTEPKLVKVDNWGIFFLQRLKHFFNRTDYCDLTLQFQDNAQLKVHRLVLSACTEYFELLERTCEMYEDCLVMPDDLQADVVVPIVNFMYTGQLEFKVETLERLYQTAVVMNMPVLTKLLESHRNYQVSRETPCHSYTNPKKRFKQMSSPSSSSAVNKRSYSKAFSSSSKSSDFDVNNTMLYGNTDPIELKNVTPKKQIYLDPRPTRYELPEELETENLFENSFSSISYTSKPLMVHPETTKRYPAKRTGIFEDPSTSKRFIHGHSTMDIVECKKISADENIFDDVHTDNIGEDHDAYGSMVMKSESCNSNQLFDQILDNGGPKVTIENKDSNQVNNLDHAKIISEVLKKYPHLVKSNKNIKLKILNTPTKKKVPSPNGTENQKETKIKPKVDNKDFVYESEVLDSKKAAQLIVLGAENITGPWICLICGAPGKAIHFSSYYKFRRHLVEVHKEKVIPNMCEYCGQKASKRNFMLHHLYTKHGVEPPPNISFPKCNICNYIALNEGFLIKHKLAHDALNQPFRCNVCAKSFLTSNQLLFHIQKTGHKYSDKKTTLQCIYCLKVFTRELNLYTHLRAYHKGAAKNDGIIDVSDDENEKVKRKENIVKPPTKPVVVQYEVPISFSNEYDDADLQYKIQQQPDDENIQLFSKKPKVLLPAKKHKILNAGFDTPSSYKKDESLKFPHSSSNETEFIDDSNISIDTQTEEVVTIDNNDYIVKNNQLILKKEKSTSAVRGFSMPDLMQADIEEPDHISTSVEFTDVQAVNPRENKMVLKKSNDINQPIQIVVSNEEEYKALMASNHSIIFEEGDAGKTLTVLTAPHENNTTIDLGTTQTSDMMIIQDNYPLNVSQAVSGENSNVVFVYSHGVDDQNKQFQLNLGEQLITSSGIITQNFETVTTSAAIVNTHIIDTPIEEAWQSSVQPNITPETEIPISDNQVTIAHTRDQQSCINEPVAQCSSQLAPDNCKAVEMQHIADNVINQAILEDSNNGEVIAPNGSEADNVTDASQLSGTCTETQSVLINSVIETNLEVTNCNKVDGENYENEQLNQELLHEEKNSQNLEKTLIEQEVEAEPSPDKQVSDNFQGTNTEESADSETVEIIAKERQSQATTPTVLIDTEAQASVDPMNTIEVTTAKANEQIKSLASEWSDDEMENCSQEQISSQETVSPKDIPETEAMETDSQTDLEESIENIQNEMEKQLARPLPSVLQKVDASKKEVDGTSHCKTVQETAPVQSTVASDNKTPVKISSLLNDWEDNEDNDCAEESVTGAEETEKCVNNPIIPGVDIQNKDDVNAVSDTCKTQQTITENDKIKSLVSDWVEEDEEEEVESGK